MASIQEILERAAAFDAAWSHLHAADREDAFFLLGWAVGTLLRRGVKPDELDSYLMEVVPFTAHQLELRATLTPGAT
jgi:hypothetical protein